MNRRKMLIASLVIGALGAMPVAYAADKGLVAGLPHSTSIFPDDIVGSE